MIEGLKPLFDKYSSSSALRDLYSDIQESFRQKKNWVNGWKKPEDYHVTCLFVGRDVENTENPIY